MTAARLVLSSGDNVTAAHLMADEVGRSVVIFGVHILIDCIRLQSSFVSVVIFSGKRVHFTLQPLPNAIAVMLLQRRRLPHRRHWPPIKQGQMAQNWPEPVEKWHYDMSLILSMDFVVYLQFVKLFRFCLEWYCKRPERSFPMCPAPFPKRDFKFHKAAKDCSQQA